MQASMHWPRSMFATQNPIIGVHWFLYAMSCAKHEEMLKTNYQTTNTNTVYCVLQFVRVI